jgi:ATPase family protein associated with various cellular activities (AAA)/winged helix domain-containing protein
MADSPTDTGAVSLAVIDAILRDAVGRVAATDPNPADPFRGLYVSDEAALDAAGGLDGGAVDERLNEFGRTLGLDSLDCELLALCAAPELDPRYGRLVGYLHDDITRRRPSPRLLARLLAGPGPQQELVLARLAAGGRLRRLGVLRIVEADAAVPVAERGLIVDELLVASLLGAALETVAAPAGLRDVVPRSPPPEREHVIRRLGRLIAAGDGVVLACVGPDAEQVLAHAQGAGLVVIAAHRLADDELCARARLRARLGGRLCVIGEVERLGDEARAGFVEALARIGGLRILVGPRDAEAGLSESVGLHAVEVPELTAGERRRLWAAHLPGQAVERAADLFLLSASQIADAAALARARAHEEGSGEVTEGDVLEAGRAVSRRSLGDLAQRLGSTCTWSDLVLPPAELRLLRSIVGFVRHRERVLDEWGFGALPGTTAGLTALFAGESGTGKTMAAQVIANELGLEVYRVDLAGVVSKYIGETEKNLDRVFAAAEHANAVLLFDEADALFGKRSAVTDARDRYANIEIAYLLQRIEGYPGVVILTTNMRQDVDQAFLRRLDFAVDFPVPGPDERVELWRRHLPASAPLDDDVDVARLGAAHRLAGGAIRNAARAAAFAAAEDGGAIGMGHLQHAVTLELRKLGRLSLNG